jgi:succinoglycan biosynthesis protein ExoM
MLPHITVCVCTYRRPEMLGGLLNGLRKQQTENKFTFSVRIVDNDAAQSAAPVVFKWTESCFFQIQYIAEPVQNIARARNRAVTGNICDYIAMIDDDEVPCDNWLLRLICLAQATGAHGVLGPVRPLYPPGCPSWLQRSGLCDRPTYPTGQPLQYHQTRTGNALVSNSLFDGEAEPFKVEFGLSGGEDIDFFRRKISQGFRFLWCNEADAFEVVLPDRWSLSYYFQRQLRLGGLLGERQRSVARFLRSLTSAITHGIQGCVLLAFGKHRYSKPLVRFAYHVGYLGAAVGLAWARNREEVASSVRGKEVTRECQSIST